MGQGDHRLEWGKHRMWEKQRGVYEAWVGGKGAGGNKSGVVSRVHTGDTWQRSVFCRWRH